MVFKITDQLIARISDETLVADTLNCLTAQFTFDSSWDGYVKTAHYSNANSSYSFPLIDDEITFDRGLNLTEGTWGVAVSGIKTVGELLVRKTTNIFFAKVLRSGFADGSPFPVISADVLEVIQADILELQNMLSVPEAGASIVVRDANGNVYVNSVLIDTAPTLGTPVPGQLFWDADNRTLAVQTLNGVTLQVNQETTIPGQNNTGVLIPDGTVICWDTPIGSSGKFRIKPFIANGTIDSERCLGLATENISNGAVGLITSKGSIRGVNTTGSEVGETWVTGDVLYAHPTMAGKMTKNKPSAPNRIVRIGAILYAHAVNGSIFVRPTIYPANATSTSDGLMSAADKAKLDSL